MLGQMMDKVRGMMNSNQDKNAEFNYDNYTPDEKDNLERQILEKFDTWMLAKRPFDAQTILSIAMYTGRQYVKWDTATGRLAPVDVAYKGQLRVVVNKVQPKCRSALARLVSRLPGTNVAPNSSDYSDMFGARCAQALLNWNYKRKDQKLPRVLRQVALWSIVCGVSWIKDEWDPTWGKRVPVDTTQEPVMEPHIDPMTGEPITDPTTGEQVMIPAIDEMDPEGRPMMQEVPVMEGPNGEIRFEGKTRTSAVSALQMLYDPNYTDWNDVIDCIQRDFVPKEWVKENIAGCEDIDELPSQPIDDAYQMMYKTLTEGPNYTAINKKGCEVLTYWSKKTMRFPRGLKCTFVNRKLKIIEPMPGLEGEQLPYSVFPYIEIMGSIRGMGLPEAMLDIQMGYNRASSLIIENAQVTATNKFLKDKNCTMTELPNDKVGQIMEVSDMNGFKQLVGQPVPQTLYQLRAALSMDFDDVSMIHKASEGGTDPNVNSEDQLALQTENDNFSNNPIMEAFQDAICESSERILIYYQAFAPPEMVVKIVGAEGRISYKSFKISDIAGNTDVYMEPASMSSQTRPAKTKEITMLTQSPLVQFAKPEQQQALIGLLLKHLQSGENQQAMNEVTAQTRAAEDNCQSIVDGQKVAVQPWYNFGIHLEVTQMRLLSPEFKTYTPEVQQALVMHWTALEQEIQREMAQKQAAMLALQGNKQEVPGTSGAVKSHPPGLSGGAPIPEPAASGPTGGGDMGA